MTMKTYRVTTYEDKATYTVSIDETGVVEVGGLPDDAADSLADSVSRHITKNGLPSVTALGLAVGPYSYVTVADDDGVSDQTRASEVS